VLTTIHLKKSVNNENIFAPKSNVNSRVSVLKECEHINTCV